jgi:hypothetical protein
MSLADIFNVLQQYSGASAANPPATTNQDFEKVAQSAPTAHIASGLNAAFQSNQTPEFSQMITTMFNQADPAQRAAILNQLLGAAGPAVSSGALGGVLGSLTGGAAQVTPQQAQQFPPEVVQQVAQHAQQTTPSVVEQASGFYAQHPKLVQALGAGALAMIMAHISENHS